MDFNRPPGIHIEQVFLHEVRFSHRTDAIGVPRNTTVDIPFRVRWRCMGDEEGDHVIAQIRFETEETPDGDEEPLYHRGDDDRADHPP